MECSACILSPIVQALVALTKTHRTTSFDSQTSSASKSAAFAKYLGDMKSNDRNTSTELNAIDCKLVHEISKKKQKKQIIEPLVAARADFRKLVALARKIMESPDGVNPSPLQSVCLACSRISDDDNLSRSGQTFVSVDAMASSGLTANSSDPAAHISLSDENDLESGDFNTDSSTSYGDEDSSSPASSDLYNASEDINPDDLSIKTAQSAHDYITANAIHIDSSSDSDSCSKLPSHIEDLLRKQLASFAELEDFEKILILGVWSGLNFAEFGTMKWVPEEIKRPQSKQLILQRWNRLVEKFPLAAALQKSAPCRNVTSALSKHYSLENAQQGVLDLQDSCWIDETSDNSVSNRKPSHSTTSFSPIFS